ncbi:superantigen-like protein SSL4 [Granulicella arctica]|uniref:hypothetical protein n=1 Tax=Granulicella arctica TaxID=940613 RepID=UPI0021E03B79|nr:hypothetical protein [Granulicella arctica]
MKLPLTTAALALSAVAFGPATLAAHAQAGATGVSHPDTTPITVESNDPAPQPPATHPKPSAYVPYSAPAPTPQTYTAAPAPKRFNPDGEIVTTDTPVSQQGEDSTYRPYRPANGSGLTTRAEADPDAGVVMEVPLVAGEMPEGTLLKVRMNNALSTISTTRGSAFSATVSDDVLREGHVVIPAGSILDGQVTEVRGGHRISGRAAIHLEPRRVTLPDGTYYVLHAQVTDTGEPSNVSVNGEGTILRRDHAKETLAIVTATTGAAAVAGAMIGGGVGAAVGAGIGAGASTILWLKQDRQTALPRNTALIFSLTTPMRMRPMQDGALLR